MSVSAPKFINSSYFVEEPDNWHLKPGAPEEVQKEFDEFMKEYDSKAKEGVRI